MEGWVGLETRYLESSIAAYPKLTRDIVRHFVWVVAYQYTLIRYAMISNWFWYVYPVTLTFNLAGPQNNAIRASDKINLCAKFGAQDCNSVDPSQTLG